MLVDLSLPDNLCLSWLSNNDRPLNDHGPLDLGWSCTIREPFTKGASKHFPRCWFGRGPTPQEAINAAILHYRTPPEEKKPPTKFRYSLDDLEL